MNPDSYTKQCFAIVEYVLPAGRKNNWLVILFVGCASLCWSQRGGERIFEFVNLPTSARATALGGSQIAIISDDYNLVGGNPAMLNESMDGSIIFQDNFHFDGINMDLPDMLNTFLNSNQHFTAEYSIYRMVNLPRLMKWEMLEVHSKQKIWL